MIGGDPISFIGVFAAGAVSFASPCVLPLVPAYIAFVSGVAFGEEDARRRNVALPTAAFVLGFSLMFAALGASVGLVGSALLEQRRVLEIAGGILVVGMGLVLLGRGVPMALMRDRRVHLARRPSTLFGSGLAGVAFAAGWTPCIGPTLAAALTIAAHGGNPTLGASLLVVYSLGLGLPFLLTGLFLQRSGTALASVRRHLPAIGRAGAAVLVAFGVLLATGAMTALTARLSALGTPL